MRTLRAQWLKTKGTSFRWLLLLLPLIYGILSGLYLSRSVIAPTVPEKLLYFFVILTLLALFFASIFIYLVVEIDKNNQSFFQEKRPDLRRWRPLLGKYIFSSLMILVLYSFSFVVFYILQRFLLGQWLPLIAGIKIVLVNVVLILPLVSFYLWLSYRFSFSVSMVTSILLTLAGILLGTTNLGDVIWPLIPSAWGLRLLTFEAPAFFEGSLLANQRIVTLSLSAISLFIVGFLCHVFWYNQWEEAKEE